MRIVFGILLMVLISLNLFSQNFEGIIDYEVTFKNPMPDLISDEDFFEKVGYEKVNQKYYYKDNHYKSIIKETGLTQHYKPEQQRLYSYIEGQKTGSWTDVTKAVLLQSADAETNIVSIEELDLVDTILGIPCKSIRVSTSMMETTYYFSDQYKIDYQRFKGHKYGAWEDYLKKACSLPLKYESIVMGMMHMETVAIHVEEKELSEKEFTLPKFKKVTENKM